MQNRSIGFVLAVVAVVATSVILLAQGPARTGRQAIKVPATGSPAVLSGVWFQREGSGVGALIKGDPPMQDWVAAKAKILRHDVEDPDLLCMPPGVPRILLTPRPFEFVPAPNRMLVLYENDHLVRQIWTDGRKLPQEPDPTWMGTSVGRWDGDTFVVDTIGLTEKSWLDNSAHLHSDALHVTERYRRVDQDTLQVDVTIDDPKAYTKLWSGQRVFKLHSDWQITEDVCTDNDENNKKLANFGK